MHLILITGASGLVGRHLRTVLEARGYGVRGLDLRAVDLERGDVRDRERVAAALVGVTGIVHLAAVSRVAWGERDPETCWSTNVDGLRNIFACSEQSAPPWLIFASSREVYGQPEVLPASEDCPLRPMNVYGRSKVAGEELVFGARSSGRRTAIVRLSNVYGCTADHADRVVPAFARNAALGSRLRVDGSNHTFDFTHITDTARGIAALVERLAQGASSPPPIHFVTGKATTLGELANLAIPLGGQGSTREEAPPRSYDVSKFHGSPDRAKALLDWAPRTSIQEGLARLIQDFRNELGPSCQSVGAP